MIGEITRAVGDHGEATRRMHASLTDLGRAAQQHEAAVAELSAVAGRMASQARSLSERMGKFRIADPERETS
jgi:methyl-accepting chemotaxis protein